jgi:hypothetical protein
MAFFSIALTLNLVGFKFSNVRLSDLRPGNLRSIVTRRIVTASIPIIRYYDHLRFLYEVESSMRLGTGQGENQPPQAPQPAAGGQSKKSTGGKNGGSHVERPVRSGNHEVHPASSIMGEYLDTSLRVNDGSTPSVSDRQWFRHAHSGGFSPQRSRLDEPAVVAGSGSATRARERSRLWTA